MITNYNRINHFFEFDYDYTLGVFTNTLKYIYLKKQDSILASIVEGVAYSLILYLV